ncbi:MAG TPA: tetratricopeptide repeat protein [Nitrospiraceae bacterium]|jgi:tetratricopeptide (TPR) repeat protein|nr:tetratricopeptide repeat protein [Nitrospiraceae bacterium]
MTGAYSLSELRRILHVTDAELRACLRAALLPASTAKHPCSYSFQQLVVLRTAKGLRDAGVSVRRIRKVLESLQRQLGDSRSMSSVKVYASGQGVVVWDGTSRWQPDSGQFVFDFEARPSAQARRLEPPAERHASRHEAAARWCERGVELQEHAPEAACRAFEEAIRLDPTLVNAHINLGLLLHEAGRLEEAEASYRKALRYGADLPLAHFNLGVLLEDRGREQDAIASYLRATHLDPKFKQAHCNLAALYERLGRQKEALRHYSAARRCREDNH